MIAAGVIWLALQVVPPRGAVPGRNQFRAALAGRPLVIAHAGGLGLNPENTLEAFAAAVALGCDMLEMDTRLTSDGVLVTIHDADVDRTSDGRGPVLGQTLAKLKTLNFGHRFRDGTGAYSFREKPARIATVEELFQQFGRAPMVIEIKDRGETGRRAAAVLASLIRQYDVANHVLIASFDDATLGAFRELAGPNVATSSAKRQTRNFVVLGLLRLDRLWKGGVAAAQVPVDPRESSGFRLATARFVKAAHGRNMAVHYWTVNEPEEMVRLIGLGADGIITDYPDRLQNLLKAGVNP
jgi:glycerophosphoryl diester phosphodiesterase